MRKEYSYVAISGILSGLVVFGGQFLLNKGLSLFQLSIIPFVIALLPLLPFLSIKKYQFKKELLPLLTIYGFVSAVLVVCEFVPLLLGIPVSILVLLLYMQPLWTIIFTKFFTKDQVGIYEVCSCMLVIIGATVLLQPWTETSTYSPLGVMIALIGGMALSGWIIVGSMLSKKQSHPISSKIAELLLPVIMISVVAFAGKIFSSSQLFEFSLKFSPLVWVFIIAYGLLSQLINHLLYLKGVQVVPALHAGIIVLLEPVSAVILSIIFLNQTLTTSIIVGGSLIIAANVLIMIKSAPSTTV